MTRAIGTLRRQVAGAEAARCPAQLSQLLLSLVNRGFANIGNPHNFAHPAHGAPRAIEDLVREVSAAIRLVCDTPWSEASGFGPLQKKAFLEAATHAHGRAALCLSGGGAVALYHLGLVHELLRHGLLPSVISGTSGGSLTAGMLAVRTDEEMIAFLETGEVDEIVASNAFIEPWTVMLRRLFTEGVCIDKDRFLATMKPLCGDLTFAEAYARTGRLVNLSTSTPSLGPTLRLEP